MILKGKYKVAFAKMEVNTHGNMGWRGKMQLGFG